jgi:hypothetical protein
MQFRPRIVVMVGIAAGTRDGNKQFGDVLVADPSVDYNSGKVVRAGDIRGFLPDPYPIGLNPRLRSVLLKYRGNHAIFRDIRNRDRGRPRDLAPPTPPYMRVRIRRFGRLSFGYCQSRNPQRIKIGIGQGDG